jgi:uncharacterized membrane-anchored protein
MKKLLMPALILIIVIQFAVPVFPIIQKYDTLKNGAEYRFAVYPVDPYDAFRGRYVNLSLRQNVSKKGKYGTILVASDGYAYIENVTDEKPRTKDFIKSGSNNWFSLPINRYYMDEEFAPRAETLVRRRESDSAAYVTVRVKEGNLVVSGLFVDGKAIEDIIKNER